MKTAIFGVWHVHAPDYTRTAQKYGEVVGFYEPDDALASAFAAHFDIPRFATADELLASDAEGVIVCSATNTHADDMIKIANAGKHIFTEKVLALTDADCARVAEAVEKNNVSFTISLFQKYLPARMAVKDVAMSGDGTYTHPITRERRRNTARWSAFTSRTTLWRRPLPRILTFRALPQPTSCSQATPRA